MLLATGWFSRFPHRITHPPSQPSGRVYEHPLLGQGSGYPPREPTTRQGYIGFRTRQQGSTRTSPKGGLRFVETVKELKWPVWWVPNPVFGTSAFPALW